MMSRSSPKPNKRRPEVFEAVKVLVEQGWPTFRIAWQINRSLRWTQQLVKKAKRVNSRNSGIVGKAGGNTA